MSLVDATVQWISSRFRNDAKGVIILCAAAAAALLSVTLGIRGAEGAPGHRPMGIVSRGIRDPQVPAGILNVPSAPFMNQDALFKSKLGSSDLGLAKPFFFKGSLEDRELSINCLAAAAWYEAGGDAEGQRAVIQVVLNRLKHPSFPKSVCGVVFQGSAQKTGCQFTFTCDGSLSRRVPSQAGWKLARARALAALNGAVDTDVLQATHYHADYVTPWWSSQLLPLAKVGAHIFYRWPGMQGALSGKPVAHFDGDLPLQGKLWGGDGGATTRLNAANDLAFAQSTAAQSNSALVAARPGSLGSGPVSAPPAIYLTVDPNGPSGRWAVDALGRCSHRTDCLVVSYGGSEINPVDQARSYAQKDRPLFLFVRDAGSGMDIALWDCTRIPRPNSGQCLPASKQELLALMKPRPS